MNLISTLQRWFPPQSDLSGKSILLSAAAALVSVILVGMASQQMLQGIAGPFLLASMGASSVLLFVVPSSPMSRPWSFVGGHLIAGLIGVTSAQLIPDIAAAAAVAAGGAILAMHLLRCMHPPGSATALLAVVGGDTVHNLGYQFLLSPVAINVAIMLGCALLYWRLSQRIHQGANRRALAAGLKRSEEKWLSNGPAFSDEDLNHAMAEMDTFLDISRKDLKEIYSRAQQHAHNRQLGSLRCAEVMSQPVISVEFGSELEEAWNLLEKYAIRGLPVIDRAQHVIGIVTVSDFVRHAEPLPQKTLAERLSHLCHRTTRLESDKPEVAGQIMTHPVLTANENQPLSEVVQQFTVNHIHHIPVVDLKQKLVGMLTREDIMAACDCPTDKAVHDLEH
ncbi:MAG TPA: CBS domain-containing protein [Gammaproteobacteria bacterium]|nr:CBS domain-containing protein [Gammaproteobacteria bacterium]